jgi:N-acetylmuramoyl-L-alanine amidase
MKNKGILSLLIGIFLVFLAGCQEITLASELSSITIKEGETLEIPIDTNDGKFVSFSSSNEDIVTIDEEGILTGESVGTAIITVTSISNPDVFITIGVTVNKLVTLTTTNPDLQVTVGLTASLLYETNDPVTFSSSDPSIATVNDEGVVTGVTEGSATITITSVTDNTVSITVTVHVRKVIELSITNYQSELVIGDVGQIMVSSNDQYTFTSSNEAILTVNENGFVTGVAAGEANIIVRSTYDDSVSQTISIKVYPSPTDLTIDLGDQINVTFSGVIPVILTPIDAYPYLQYESSDTSILSFDNEGIATVHKAGTVTVTIISEGDVSIVINQTFTIVNYILVVPGLIESSYLYNAMTFTKDIDVFDTVEDALPHVSEGTTLILAEGSYTTDFTLAENGVTLTGLPGAVIESIVTVAAHNISILDLVFDRNGQIMNSDPIENLTIQGVQTGPAKSGSFMTLTLVDGLTITNNVIEYFSGHAISVTNYRGGIIEISKNQINRVYQGIIITPDTTYESTTEIKVERNVLYEMVDGIVIETGSVDIHAYARFNSVTDVSRYLAGSNLDNSVEFTLNHWGMDPLDMAYFNNIEPKMLLGHYVSETDILTETEYIKTLPAKIIVENPITEIMMGDTYTINYLVLPFDLVTTSIRWITSNPDVMLITREGLLTPIRSGEVTLTVRSTIDTSINTSITITVTTTPGIELTPSVIENIHTPSTTFTLEATPFPASISDAEVNFVSSDPLVASVDPYGIITNHTPGIVTITASLVDDPDVQAEYTFEVYSSLDENSLLDLLTMNMVTYTTPHHWTAVGVGFNYDDFKYESVSRFYFDEIVVNQSKIVPVSTGIRPGEGFDPHPEGITQYNPYNVYWVVVHDTANTNPGAGALAHANYLYSNAMAGTELWVSWHFTMDDKEVYQHLPEIERGYHAGDGSTLPGQGTYAGGGNRNGIGIEMGVNQDADVYRIWQRTAKLANQLLVKYNLPSDHMKYHVDFSGKNCPQTLRNAGLIPLFEKMADVEYKVAQDFSDATITFVSDHPEYLDNTGRIIKMPDHSMTVSFTVSVMIEGITTTRTFYSYLPGTIR